MTIEEVREDASSKTPSAHNRFVMLAVLAFVGVVTVYLVKKNLEPPPPTAPGTQQQSAEQEVTSEAAMQSIMTQVAHLKEMLARDSSNYEVWVALGNAFYDANMPEEAIEHYEQALTIRPGDPGVMTDLSTMKRALDRPQEAIEVLRRVVEIDSTFEKAWFNLGVICAFDLGDKRGAVDAWKRYLAVAAESPHVDAIRKEVERLERELEM